MSEKEEGLSLFQWITTTASAGLPVPVDPDDAEVMGAIEDDALSVEEAMESRFDQLQDGDQ